MTSAPAAPDDPARSSTARSHHPALDPLNEVLFALPEQARVPLRILLVEDSRADAELLLDMLEDELPDAIVAVSSSVAEAVPLLAGPLDIAITDLSLPDAVGLQALSAILTARPDIAVVVMTGRQDRDLALRALAQGAEDYLVKGSIDARGVATAVLYAAQRRAAETQAHRYERIALSLLDAIEASTCAVDRDGIIIAVNRAWRDFVIQNGGDPNRSGVGMSYFDVCGVAGGPEGESAAEVAGSLRELLEGGVSRFEREYPRHSATEDRWLSVRGNSLPESGAVLSHVDISEAKLAQKELSHLTLHDPLTNLPNRQLLSDRLGQALAFAIRSDRDVAVAFLDLDQFKRINDSLGHAAGDELLCAVADRLRGSVRAGDTVARFAGDEFVVVWPSIGLATEADYLARRLADALTAPFVLQVATVTVTASIGVAIGRPPIEVDDLLVNADAAMYYAKSHGRGMTRWYTEELRWDVATHLRTEEDLRAGLKRGEFVLSYQPVIDLRSRIVTGVEALIRWNHPNGLRMPDTFIPVAEATGLIVPLGEWVLQEACRQSAAWSAQGLDLEMAVNFSARQINHPDIIKTIKKSLRDTGMRPELLWVEVTESTVMDDVQVAQSVFGMIGDLGAAVAIDDFGTGYSSLLYLKRYPVGGLKVDRQFVSGIGINDDDDAIVTSVISLSHALGAVCIAEGVETAEQAAALRELGCEYAQGYYFGRPARIEDFPEMLARCNKLLEQPIPEPRMSSDRAARAKTDPTADRISELIAQGASLHTIAAVLNREGTPNSAGQQWRSTSVAKLIAAIAEPWRTVAAPAKDR